MKRELLCVQCGLRSIATWGMHKLTPADQETGEPAEVVEHVRGTLKLEKPPGPLVINGKAFEQKTCVCDNCMHPLPKGSKVICRTFRFASDPARSWEDQFIDPIEVGI